MTCAMSAMVLMQTCVSPVMDSPTSPLEHVPPAVLQGCIQIKTSTHVKNVILHVPHVMDLEAITAVHVLPNISTMMAGVSHVLQDTISTLVPTPVTHVMSPATHVEDQERMHV